MTEANTVEFVIDVEVLHNWTTATHDDVTTPTNRVPSPYEFYRVGSALAYLLVLHDHLLYNFVSLRCNIIAF